MLPRRHIKQVSKILCPLQEIPHHSIPDHRANPLLAALQPTSAEANSEVIPGSSQVRTAYRQGWPELPKNTAQLSQLLQGLKQCARPRTRLTLTLAILNQLIHGMLNNHKLSKHDRYPVADPERFQGFHGTPLSAKKTHHIFLQWLCS